jgi:hypothetical protein
VENGFSLSPRKVSSADCKNIYFMKQLDSPPGILSRPKSKNRRSNSSKENIPETEEQREQSAKK